MTTKYMRLHGLSLPRKPKPKRKRLKPIIKRIIHPGQVVYPMQAKVLHDALGWMDTVQFRNLAMDVVKRMHIMGFRIAKLSPKKIIRTRADKLAAAIASNTQESQQ